nr:hypothetical protein [Tanacetum cinerariifolium]
FKFKVKDFVQDLLKIQVAQKKVKIDFENADLSLRVELIPSKIKYAIKALIFSIRVSLVVLLAKVFYHPGNRLERSTTGIQQVGEYDIWAMKMHNFISSSDLLCWNIVLKGNSAKSMTTDNDGNLKICFPVTAEEHQQVQRKEKPRTILLYALLDEHMGDFYHMIDAKDIWNAIKARFGGNAESKKMQKSLLKQKFEEFKFSKEEGLDKGYDKMQKILTQMNTLKIKPEPEDVNIKFLRGLPPSWSGIALILLYNKLKFLEIDTKGYSSSSSTLSNAAFVTTTRLSQGNLSYQEGNSGYTTTLSITKEDFKEYDLKHQMAMLSIKVHRFEKKHGRKIKFNGRENARFDKKLVKCFNCKQMGHFSRECRAQEEKSNVLEYRQKLIDRAAQEKQDLMTKLDNEIANQAKWNNSGKNLYKLIDSSMSVRTKRGLGLDKYIGEGELGIDDSKFSIFYTNSDELEEQPIYNRFASVDHIKAVPPSLTGNYMPPSNIPNIDESQMVYGKKATDSSEIKTNDDSISHSHDSVLFDFNDRQEDFPSVYTSSIETDVKSSKTLCNKFGSFNKESHFRKHKSVASKSCYVCGSYLHLIKDCDLHEQRLAKRNAEGNGILGKRLTGKLVHPNRPKPVSAGQPHPVADGQPNPVSTGDGILGLRTLNIQPKSTNFHSFIHNNQQIIFPITHNSLYSLYMTGGLNGKTAVKPSVGWPWTKYGMSKTKGSKINGGSKSKSWSSAKVNPIRPKPVSAGQQNPVSAGPPNPVSAEQQNTVSAGQPNPVSAGQLNPVSAGQPNPISAGKATLTCNSIPLSVSAGDGILGPRPLNIQLRDISLRMEKAKNKGTVDSGCSRSMSGNKEKLDDFEEFDGGATHRVLFTENECLVLSKDFPLSDPSMVILSIPRKHNLYTFSLNEFAPKGPLTCLIAKASQNESTLWHRRLGHVNFKNMNKLKNQTLIEAARTMLADSLLPTIFWTEAEATACYVLNRVLVTKPHDKTPYELLTRDKPSISYLNPFGYHVTILNTSDPLGKFDKNSNEGYIVGVSSTNLTVGSQGAAPSNVGSQEDDSNSDDEPHVLIIQSTPTPVVPIPTGSACRLVSTGRPSGSTARTPEFVGPDENNLERSLDVHSTITKRIHNIHPSSKVLGDINSPVQTRRQALADPDWVEAMQAEMQQFRNQKVNKARLVAQGNRQEERIDYTDVFASVARIEAIRLFLAFASFMGFTVYQMDVKSAFLYGNIAEEVYVTQPRGFEDPNHPKNVYKVVKALYGLHQAPRAVPFLAIDFFLEDFVKGLSCSSVSGSNGKEVSLGGESSSSIIGTDFLLGDPEAPAVVEIPAVIGVAAGIEEAAETKKPTETDVAAEVSLPAESTLPAESSPPAELVASSKNLFQTISWT